ncbi:hypothetical protein [Agaribacter flavus]|uniref:DUF2029 domain-containing protein n=1 Tax=Agaribacter flavus TaxID=1902781 RepID=A0ABV7FL48_9ALTE
MPIRQPLQNLNNKTLVALAVLLLSILASFPLANTNWAQVKSLGLGWMTVAQYISASLAMIIVWRFGPQSNRWRDYVTLLIFAIAIRLFLVPVDTYTSNDVDRYMFDGKVALSGYDPYRVNHNAPELETLRQTWPTPEEHAKYPTLYPPAAIGLYALSAASGSEYAELVWKFLSFVASSLTVVIMMLVLKGIGKLKHFSLVAFSPILIFEAGVGAHIDAFSSLVVSAALLAYQRKNFALSGMAIAFGALSKLMPILLLIPLFFSMNKLSHALKFALAAVITVAAGYLIVLSLGMQAIGSTPVFFEKWRNAAPLFDALSLVLSGYYLLAFIVATLFISFCLNVIWTWKHSPSTESNTLLAVTPALQWILIVPLLLSPVVFPWYLMVLVPLFALRPTFFLAAWFSLLPLSYLVLNQFACCHIWAPLEWTNYLLAVGLVLGLILDQLYLSCNTTESCNHGQLA